jgi:uncharacterized protein
MSTSPQLRREDRAMNAQEIKEFLMKGFCGRVGTVSAGGTPYCVPLLYVCLDDDIYVHNTRARGHLRTNVEHSEKVCFEVDEAGEIFPYGRFECDTSVSYRSVIAFGRIGIVEDEAVKRRFLDGLMEKYANRNLQRPKGFYPRLDAITVYRIQLERVTGKRLALPAVAEQWPAKDRSMSPNAHP